MIHRAPGGALRATENEMMPEKHAVILGYLTQAFAGHAIEEVEHHGHLTWNALQGVDQSGADVRADTGNRARARESPLASRTRFDQRLDQRLDPQVDAGDELIEARS